MMSRAKQFFVFLIIALVPAAAMTWKILNNSGVKCEVCITYKGATKCRGANGPDNNACQQTATDNACAFISSGMTESIGCSSTQPTSVKFY